MAVERAAFEPRQQRSLAHRAGEQEEAEREPQAVIAERLGHPQ